MAHQGKCLLHKLKQGQEFKFPSSMWSPQAQEAETRDSLEQVIARLAEPVSSEIK